MNIKRQAKYKTFVKKINVWEEKKLKSENRPEEDQTVSDNGKTNY